MVLRSSIPALFCLAFGVCSGAVAQAPAAKGGPAVDFDKEIQPIFTKYCTACHGGKKPKAGLALDSVKDVDGARRQPKALWEKIIHNVKSREMPPGERPKPEPAEIDRLVRWIELAILRVDCSGPRDPGRVTLRRLNKAEYQNTLRDLLGIQVKLTDDFPSDDVGYGFDNIGDVLSLSPLHLERYLAAAEKAAELAFQNNETRQRLLARPKELLPRAELARRIIENLARRAYRRPVSAEEVSRLLRFLELAEQNGQGFDKGVQLALQAMLVSPHFLFRVELDRAPTLPGGVHPLGEHELATRLSYFLWSSMPDEELSGLADRGELRNNLQAQVRRMLRDPKTHALTENFAGQWLQLRSLRTATPDPVLFPAFNPELRAAMIEETERFFEAVVREDRSILDFIDADFTFVNEVLARHYGISDVQGKEFRRVNLNPEQRGGVLTHASILTVTSNPTRTSPVKRGKWILENILNTPPPPPIPEAGELDNDPKAVLKGSLRQRMEMHRAKPICASCHQRMDPLGFAFENFDAVGAWRTHDGKFLIDPSGTLPEGQTFKGPRELRAILKARQADFRRCLAEKMLTYALGRGLEYYDKCAVDDICQATAREDNRFSALVLAITRSEPFQLRKSKKSVPAGGQ